MGIEKELKELKEFVDGERIHGELEAKIKEWSAAKITSRSIAYALAFSLVGTAYADAFLNRAKARDALSNLIDGIFDYYEKYLDQSGTRHMIAEAERLADRGDTAAAKRKIAEATAAAREGVR